MERLAILRLDGDLYECTPDSPEALYDKVSLGGLVIVDDYGCRVPCWQAVTDYRDCRNISDPIHEIEWTGVNSRKQKV
jgi:O-methyltransferase